MTDYFRGKTLICEQTKPRTYFTPIFQRIGDSLKLHHMEADCLSYQHSKKMFPVENMGKHKRRIFELEDENAKLRDYATGMLRLITVKGYDCYGCDENRMSANSPCCFGECKWVTLGRELGIEVPE